MKSAKNPASLRGVVLIALFVTSTLSLFGQSLPRIEARFSNPTYQSVSRTYSLDVELKSVSAPEIFFGMNLRFFYDASLMEFTQVDQFKQGYGILGEAPVPAVGNPQSGTQLFGFSSAAAYINGGIILLDERSPLEIPSNGWVKAFRVNFKVPVTLKGEDFCPSVIWDLEATEGAGGFLPGSAGLVITVADQTRNSRFESAPTVASGLPFNWKYNEPAGLPYGAVVSADCIFLGALVNTGEAGTVKGYKLYQNQPNPFETRTFIDFELPFAQKATIVFYDVDGVVKESIEGDYAAGKNRLELKQKPWMGETSVVYYRLYTDKYTSKTFSMSLVRA